MVEIAAPSFQSEMHLPAKLEVVQGLGSTGGFWFIKVTKEDKFHSITYQGALSKKQLTLELTKINQYLYRNT